MARFAGVLKAQGVEKGDRVVIYMPMIPQAVIAMLAVARLGAVHSVVFGGFAAPELAVRIEDAEPKVVVTAMFAPANAGVFRPVDGRGLNPFRITSYNVCYTKLLRHTG